MTGWFAGKVALVTGGLSGIGQAIVCRFADHGAHVIAADLSADTGPLGSKAVASARLDVSDPAAVAALVAEIEAAHGKLDILVNSAGIGKDAPFLDTSLDLFDRMVAVNLRGTFIVGQEAARLMARGRKGSIVNIASVSGMRGNLGRAAYGASKGGVVVLSQVMAVDLAAHGIRVNVVAPGPIDTPLVAAMHDLEIRETWTRAIPMRRYGSVEEVAAAATFLCSDEAGFITGHVLAVDGGFLGAGLSTR